ncbi:hypothetical protein [uncultured Ruegeria sp.]|nr:hypothetical protein [uncultured Ruegeria sp.]
MIRRLLQLFTASAVQPAGADFVSGTGTGLNAAQDDSGGLWLDGLK